MSNLRIIIIDEPIRIYDDLAWKIFADSLRAKDLEYNKYYADTIIPFSTEDFFSTHVIIADEVSESNFTPLSMYRISTRYKCKAFCTPFGPEALIKGSEFENSLAFQKVLRDSSNLAYLSAWSGTADYRSNPKQARQVRDLITATSCLMTEAMDCYRWLVAAVVQRKADHYLKWIGCEDLFHNTFKHPTSPSIDLRMMLLKNTRSLPNHTKKVIEGNLKHWERRIEFKPSRKATAKVA